MSRKYANPPIIEAVCEFRFTPDSPWDLTIPGLVYEKIGDEFPVKEQRVVQQVEIGETEQGLRHQVRASERMWFLTTDRNIFVQLGTHLLAVNSLKPYPTWARLKPRIERAFRAVVETVEVTGLERTGLRYINRIEIPGEFEKPDDYQIDFDQYFEFRPHLGHNLPQTMTDFIVGSVLDVGKPGDRCRVQLTNAVRDRPNVAAFILDLDYFLAEREAVAVDRALEWVENAHQQVEAIFEGCVSDRLRAIFGEEK